MSSHHLLSPANLSSSTGISFPGNKNSKTLAAKQYSIGQKTMKSIIKALHKNHRNSKIILKEERKENNNLDSYIYDLNEEELLNVILLLHYLFLFL